MFFTIIIFIVVLSVLVFVHELGHFLTARKLGVKAEEFGFGFPPRIFGVYRDQKKRWRFLKGNKSLDKLATEEDKAPSDTVYSLNYILAGGFVKIKGENGEGKLESDSFASKSAWKKALILAAGVIMNIVLAWFLLSVAYLFGMPENLDMAGKRANIENPQVMVIGVLEDSPADKADIVAGEVILKVDNQAVDSFSTLQELIKERVNQETKLLLEGREEAETREVVLVPELNEELDRAVIGVDVYSTATISYPFFESFWQGAKSTGMYLKLIVVAFYHLFADIFAGESVEGQVGGPIAIAKYTGEVARFGLMYLLQFVALLSLNLAIINILPIPALDGGRLLFLLIEKIKGKPMRQDIENIFHTFFFFLLIVLILFVTYKDIINLF
jgi:regulator of sigma E protease